MHPEAVFAGPLSSNDFGEIETIRPKRPQNARGILLFNDTLRSAEPVAKGVQARRLAPHSRRTAACREPALSGGNCRDPLHGGALMYGVSA